MYVIPVKVGAWHNGRFCSGSAQSVISQVTEELHSCNIYAKRNNPQNSRALTVNETKQQRECNEPSYP